MTEKRFEVGNLKIQDTAPKGRVYLLDMQGGVNALCSLINGLNDKSNRLEKENEQLKQFKNTVFDLIDKEIKETKEIFEEGKIDLMTYNDSMIALTGLKEQLKSDVE